MTEEQKRVLEERGSECQDCGPCCSHRGLILPSETNIREPAKHLRMSEWSFATRYLREVYDTRLDAYIMAFKTDNSQDPKNGCILHFGSFCAIYDSCRTDLCKVFSWNHFSAQDGQWEPGFADDAGKFWCRGIGKGREWTIEEIRELKEKYTNLGVGFRRYLTEEEAE